MDFTLPLQVVFPLCVYIGIGMLAKVFRLLSREASAAMALEMDADGPLAGEILAVTTVCSMGTVFLWVLALSQMGLLAF